MALIPVFRRNEPPGAVLLNWPANRTAKLLAREVRRGLSPVEGCRQTLQHLMPEEDKPRAVVIIRARLDDDVDDAGAGPADFSGEFVRCNLKFADAILRQIGQRSAYHLVIVVPAVDGDVAATAKCACRRDFQSVGFC